jgi:hypothetical protein
LQSIQQQLQIKWLFGHTSESMYPQQLNKNYYSDKSIKIWSTIDDSYEHQQQKGHKFAIVITSRHNESKMKQRSDYKI